MQCLKNAVLETTAGVGGLVRCGEGEQSVGIVYKS